MDVPSNTEIRIGYFTILSRNTPVVSSADKGIMFIEDLVSTIGRLSSTSQCRLVFIVSNCGGSVGLARRFERRSGLCPRICSPFRLMLGLIDVPFRLG